VIAKGQRVVILVKLRLRLSVLLVGLLHKGIVVRYLRLDFGIHIHPFLVGDYAALNEARMLGPAYLRQADQRTYEYAFQCFHHSVHPFRINYWFWMPPILLKSQISESMKNRLMVV